MSKQKIIEALNLYENYFNSLPTITEQVLYCRNMIPKIRNFIKEDQMGKTFRWLGFIQGCLWSYGHFSIDELKNHNRR